MSLSVASLYLQEAGQQAHPIKMLRFVKVFTCLKANPKILKLCSPLFSLVKSIGFCVIPMMMAFGILFVATITWSVFGVSFFGTEHPGRYADLKTALLTTVQVATGDLSVAFEIFEHNEAGTVLTNPVIALFFVSYWLVGNVLLLDVVVTVLLDEFIANVDREKHAAGAFHFILAFYQGICLKRTSTSLASTKGSMKAILRLNTALY